MPLESDIFTKPTRNDRLEACLVDDAAHVTLRTPREKGKHVSRIQTALFLVLPDVNLEDELGGEMRSTSPHGTRPRRGFVLRT